MSKVAHYLQEHLVGDVISNTDARDYFSVDNGIFQLEPNLIVYPKSENDVRKTARFTWQLAERGRIIPITPRGIGSSQSGAAIGQGIILVFAAYMNRVLELNTKLNTITIEPGINFSKMQQTLHTHGRFVPTYPPSIDYTTVGGSIANNVSGQKSIKYGDTVSYLKGLRVVLANGEVIETKRLHKKELSKKLGLATFEGEIYRSIDTMLEEKHDLIEQLIRPTSINNAGYNLVDIKHKDGTFDLTPLIAGSQGTLGIITEAIIATENYTPKTTLIVSRFDSIEFLQRAVLELRNLEDSPSAIEFINNYAIQQIYEINPNRIADVIQPPLNDSLLYVEFEGDHPPKKSFNKALKILSEYSKQTDVFDDLEDQLQQWKIRESISTLLAHNEGLIHAVPLFDGVVPVDRVREYIEGIYNLMSSNNFKPALWGHIGEGNLQFRPKLNLGQVGDRQKVFRLMDEYNKLVIDLNGSISASDNDGRIRAPYLEQMYGSEVYSMLYKIKQIFDPYSTLNPGVKFGTEFDDLKAIVRQEYSIDHLYNHLPRD